MEQATSPTVLIHLPRGPFLHDEEDDVSTVSILQSTLTCPIVQINYRLSREQQFPTPVHDVLAGYDWILENLLSKRAITRAGRSEHVGKIAVCGELIGGGLATALALTECRIGEPGIVAAAVNNPLVDWVSLEEPATRSVKRSRRNSSPAVPGLAPGMDEVLSSRTQLFKRPGDYFDPFASPILFFRSAGVEVPPEPVAVPGDDMEYLSILEREDFLLQEGSREHPGASLGSEISDDKVAKVQRKSSRRFPSKALRLRLPSFHISTGLASPLKTQTSEFTTLIRQSLARQSKHAMSNTHEFGLKVLLDEEEDGEMDHEQLLARNLQRAEAEEKARFETYDGLGLWDGSTDGRARVLGVAEWLRGIIR